MERAESNQTKQKSGKKREGFKLAVRSAKTANELRGAISNKFIEQRVTL